MDARPSGLLQPIWIGLLRAGATEEAAGGGCASAWVGLPRRRRPGTRRWGAGSGGSGGCCGWERAGSACPWNATAERPTPPPLRQGSRRPKGMMGGGGSCCGAGQAAPRSPQSGPRLRRRASDEAGPAPTAAPPRSPASASKALGRSGSVSARRVVLAARPAPFRPRRRFSRALARGQCPRTVVPGWCMGWQPTGGLGSKLWRSGFSPRLALSRSGPRFPVGGLERLYPRPFLPHFSSLGISLPASHVILSSRRLLLTLFHRRPSP